MRILLATPLYPPDIAEPGPYVKELAKRLAREHDVTVLAYGRLPEKVEGVSIVAIDKRQPLPARLFLFTLALIGALRRTDAVIAENGPSVELPLSIASLLARKRIVVHMGDRAAHSYASAHSFRNLIERVALARASAVLEHSPLPRPEILPFDPYPAEAFSQYEKSWSAHLNALKEKLHA